MSNRKMTDAHIAKFVELEREGQLTPEEVVAEAKQPESPLHDLFDWNIARSAERYWIMRARHLIGTITVIIHTETATYTIPKYVRSPDVPARQQGYSTIDRVRIDPTLARRALITECERVASSLKRAREIAVGLSMEEDFDQILERIVGLRTFIEAQTESTEQQPGAVS